MTSPVIWGDSIFFPSSSTPPTSTVQSRSKTRREALGSTTRPSSWPDRGHDEARSGKWATRRDAVTSAEVRSLHADSGTDQGRVAQALDSGACVASSRDQREKWFCRNLV